jgi:predicted Mrr-cat superfamily restriction endonuclease
MKVYSNEQPEAYSASGNELRIRWDIQEVTKPDMEGNDQTSWEANEALCSVFDDRASLIEKIIGSVHTPGAEIALINNKDIDPSAYSAYQAFRDLAKTLADNWLDHVKTANASAKGLA